jgi:hypothetical protein
LTSTTYSYIITRLFGCEINNNYVRRRSKENRKHWKSNNKGDIRCVAFRAFWNDIMNKSLVIQEKYGGVLVTYTFQDKKDKNIIHQINYLIPKRRENGTFLNDEITDVLIGKNTLIISFTESKISEYIKILGEESNIEFSKMKKVNNEDMIFLENLMGKYRNDIYDKKIQLKEYLKELEELSHNGDIYSFDRAVNNMKKSGIRIKREYISVLRERCYKLR